MIDDQITVVINTFQSDDKIYHCLESIDPKIKILIVENSKNLNFKKNIETKFSNVNCILSGENLGYAKGNNLGLSSVNTKYALILNPDTIVDKDAIKNFFISANKLVNFSIIGPAKQNEFTDKDENFDRKSLFQVSQLKGFAMFLNLHQFKDIGFFDENFFIYLEEIDLCKRLRDRNKYIYLDKDIIISHSGGSSHNATINFEMELSRNWHWMWSKFYFHKKHFGYLNALRKVSKNFISSITKFFFYTITFNSKKRKIYFQRFSGLFNSMIGKKSWYRPKISID